MKPSRPAISRKPRRATSSRPRAKVISSWSLLVIDGNPIRKKAQRDYQRAARDLSSARAESERFHTQDKPLYSQWLSGNFGGLLTDLRDLQARLIEAQHLVNEVQQEYFFGGHASIIAAYKKVLHRRAHPEEPEPDPFENERAQHDEADPTAAEGFWERFHDLNTPSKPRSHSPGTDSNRLKILYRKLARRLHPDNGQEITQREKELWHQTQTAYENGQVDVLETILAAIEVDELGPKNATVATLMQLTAGLKQSLRALRRELSQLRRDIAWNFSNRADHSDLVRATHEALNGEREKLLWLLTKYQAQIERWELQSRVTGKRVRSQRKNWTDEEWF